MKIVEFLYLGFFQLIAAFLDPLGRRIPEVKELIQQGLLFQVLYSTVLPIVFLFISLLLRRYFRELLARSSPARAWIDEIAKFEGVWISRTSRAERPYAVAVIKYDKNQAITGYRGRAFDSALISKARWHDNIVAYVRQQRSIFFYGQGELESSDGIRRGDVVGRLWHSPDNVKSLRGYVCDVGRWTNARENESFDIVEMKKLSLDETRNIIKRRWPEEESDYRALMQAALEKGIITRI
jgi:hypothetical protein